MTVQATERIVYQNQSPSNDKRRPDKTEWAQHKKLSSHPRKWRQSCVFAIPGTFWRLSQTRTPLLAACIPFDRCRKVDGTTRNDCRNGMFINHLCYRIAKQYNVLIKRFNLPLQFDTVYQINGNRHMLATQGIEERVLQQLAFIAHAISPYCLKLSRLGYLLTQAARELGSCCSKDEMGVKHNTTSTSIRPVWHVWQQSVTQFLLRERTIKCHFILQVSIPSSCLF